MADPRVVYFENKDEFELKCSFAGCQFICQKPSRLSIHENTHTSKRPYKCSFKGCTKDYKQTAHLKRHTDTAHRLVETEEADLFRCEQVGCTKSYNSVYSLKKHVLRLHTNLKNYACTTEGCEEAFTKRFQLRRHMFEHKGTLPFQCHYESCMKKFSQTSHLKRHLKAHEGYSCDVVQCGIHFDKWSLLRKHKAQCHKPKCLRSATDASVHAGELTNLATLNFNESSSILITSVVVPIIIVCILVSLILCKKYCVKKEGEVKIPGEENVSLNGVPREEEVSFNDGSFNARLFLDTSQSVCYMLNRGIIYGLTVLNNELFVVPAYASQVNVYDKNNLTHMHDITITGSSCLRAVVASEQYNCLYISNDEPAVIYRYNLSDNVITSWVVGKGCGGLSLTSTHNVLVTVAENRQIEEYTPDGSTLVRKIILDGSIVDPWRSVQLSSDQFVVSHGCGRSPDSLHRVCIVDTSGCIIQSYGGPEKQLHEPNSLAVDSYGNVLVADMYNNRVELLSPKLTHIGYIAELGDYKLCLPVALHLDPATRRLYIGESTDTGRVSVLTV